MQDKQRNSFQPPKPGGRGRSFALALLAHALLLAALTWGIDWKTKPDNSLSVSAELWSAVPREAAPRLQEPAETAPTPEQKPEPPPQAKPEPQVAPKPEPQPQPLPPKPVAKPEPERQDAEIALKKEKNEREKKQREDKLRQEKLREEKAKELKEKEQKAKAEKLKEEDKEREKKKLAEKAKQSEQKKRAEATALKEAQEKEKEEEEEKQAEADRQTNIRRIKSLAGASGDDNAKGSAPKASGPSASYAGRIRARIKPNIAFNDDVDGNPKAEVEVRVGTDGTILSRKLIQASGNKAWDEAVLKAIDKTGTLPRDTDGQVQPVMVISFRPKD
ncbi:cell envelope integrity protein TolA [Limnohabitans sp. Rim8]|uniref:cell envelope integrity protein TolA n=1 Tax=Limnohabitans sp. Rim8 TaxID=1100718 RepID=UPI003305859B